MVLIALVFSLLQPAARAQQCDTKDTATNVNMVERINKRYDDFFRYREHQEERELKRDRGRDERKAALAEHEKKMEKARLEYIKNRRPKPDTTELEKKAEAQQKERSKKLEIARRCYVEQQNAAEAVLKRGRMIPGDKEYGLDQ